MSSVEFDDEDGLVADMPRTDEYGMEEEGAAMSAAAASSSSSHSASKRRRAEGAEQKQQQSNGRPARRQPAVNYSQMDGQEEEEGDEEEHKEGAEGEGEARPAKKRRSTSSSTPNNRKRRSGGGEESEADGEERKHAAPSKRKKRSSASAAASAAASASASAALPPSPPVLGPEDEFDPSAPPMSDEARRQFARGGQSTPPRFQVDPSKVAECGIILRLRLRNFLNHLNFDIKFNPNVNFIYGMNGAGKSSILHALQVVFGRRATDTSRAGSLKDLVNFRKQEAEISVFLKNEGEGAYHPDQYGPLIQLTRRIRKTGNNSFELRNANTGVQVSTSSHTVRDLCEHFNIQVSNPCVVMTQEVAKKFLQNEKPEDKYTFFLEATQLEWLRKELLTSREQSQEMGATVQVQKDKVPQLDKQILDLQKQESLAAEAETLNQEIEQLSNQLAWRHVKDLEIQYDKFEMERDTLQAELERLMSRKAELESELASNSELESQRQQSAAIMDQHHRRAQELSRGITAKDQAIHQVKQEQKAIHVRKQNLHKQIQDKKRQLKQVEAEIAAIALANSKDTSEADAKRAERRKALEDQKQQLEQQREALTEEFNKLHTEDTTLRAEEGDLQRGVNESTTRRNQISQRLRMLEQQEGGAAAGRGGGAAAANHAPRFNPNFGFYTQEIRAEIDKETAWQVKPIGPLGEYVQIRKEGEAWLPGLTECLTRKHLSSYLADNLSDQHRLQSILQRVWARHQDHSFRPIVMVLRQQSHFAFTRPQVPFPLVLDFLQIDDDWAFKALLVACKPERYGLHPSLSEAERAIRPFRALYHERDNDFVTGSFLPDGVKISIRGRSEQGSLVREPPSERPIFKISQQEAIQQTREQMQAAEADIVEAKKAVDGKRVAKAHIRAQMNNLNGQRLELGRQLSVLDAELGKLADEEDRQRYQLQRQDDSQYQSRKQDLLNEIGEAEAEMAELEASDFQQFQQRVEALEEEKRQLLHKKAIEEQEADAEAQRLQEYLQRFAQHQHKLNKYGAAIAKQQAVLSKLEPRFAAVSAELGNAEKVATDLCPDRVDTSLSISQLQAQIDAKERTLDEKRRSAPVDLAKVQMELKSCMLLRAQTEENMAGVLANQANIKSTVEHRVRQLKEYRRSLAQSADFMFNRLLSLNGASGRLEFDQANRRLNLIVNPNVRDFERTDTASTTTLSGGERSVTTIAFVMAVGEQMECPFRAIDEFDVFMDSVNRRTCMDLLLNIARMRKDRQFFFLSPQDISGIQQNEYLTVHKLRAPEKNQQTLNFGGAAAAGQEGEE